MENQKQHLEDLTEIRQMMERSTRFISLSGLSGIFVGIVALAGAIPAWHLFGHDITNEGFENYAFLDDGTINREFFIRFLGGALIILVLAVALAILFTYIKARSKHQPFYDKSARRLLINLFLPLLAGGIFCLALLFNGYYDIIIPGTLVFYGLALFNAGKYTLNDIRYLGLCEILLGLVCTFFPGFGLLFWITGFGILHIIYGTIMYFKYER